MNTRFAVRSAILVALLMSLGQLVTAPAAAQKPEQPGKSQKPGTAETTATTTITTAVVPLTIAIDGVDLDFGEIFSFQPSGSVTIEPDGSVSITGGVVLIPSFRSPAEFSVTGEPNAMIVITLPTEVSLARRGGGNPVIVRRFTSDAPDTETARLGPGPGDKLIIFVGATIDVQPNERAGDYIASFIIFVDYAQ